MLSQVIDLIEKHERFGITSHIRPDGDSLGSSLALCWILRGLKKDAEVIMADHVPHAYARLPGSEDVRVAPDIDRPYDAVFVIECSDVTRPGLPSRPRPMTVRAAVTSRWPSPEHPHPGFSTDTSWPAWQAQTPINECQ